MGLFDLLFGKMRKRGSTTPAKREGPPRPEAENLRRWRESGQPRAWVEARKGQWDHQEWLGLLETLQRSPYWPMRPTSLGQVLEEVKAGLGERK